MKLTFEVVTPKALLAFAVTVIVIALLASKYSEPDSSRLKAAKFKSHVFNYAPSGGVGLLIDTIKHQYVMAYGDVFIPNYTWGEMMDYSKLRKGMTICKNAGSDTITFLDSNRNYIGFVVFK